MANNEPNTITISANTPLHEATQSSWRDFLGIVASISCAIHCAVMPIAIGYLPLLGLEFLAHESFHQWMVLICFGIALLAFVPGWRRHRRALPAAVGISGLSVIAASAFFFTDSCCVTDGGSGTAITHACTDSCCLGFADAIPGSDELSMDTASPLPMLGNYASWLTPFGGLMLVGAHLLNHRYTCRRSCCVTDLRQTES